MTSARPFSITVNTYITCLDYLSHEATHKSTNTLCSILHILSYKNIWILRQNLRRHQSLFKCLYRFRRAIASCSEFLPTYKVRCIATKHPSTCASKQHQHIHHSNFHSISHPAQSW